MRFVILSVFALALQGCVGVAYIHDKTTHIVSPIGAYPVDVSQRGGYFSGAGFVVHNKDELRARWGEPDVIWFEGGSEKWRYKKNISWAVFVPELVIPIPLGVPTGHTGVTFTFQGSNIVAEDADDTNWFNVGCGYYVVGVGCMDGSHLHGVPFLIQTH